MKRKLIKQAGLLCSAAILSFAVTGTASADDFSDAMESIMKKADAYPDLDCALDERTSTGQRYLEMNIPGFPGLARVDVSGPDGRAVRLVANEYCNEMQDGEAVSQ